MKPLKLIICTDGIYPLSIGGMQKHSRLLIEHLVKNQGIELIIIHPHPSFVFPPSPNLKEIKIEGIDRNKTYLMECYKYSKRVFNVIEKYPDHLIYSQGLSVWYNAGKLSKRLIVNPHGLESYQAISIKDKLTGFLFKKIFNHIFRNAGKVISLGGKLTKILEQNIKNARDKIVVISNGVEIQASPGINHLPIGKGERISILLISRFEANKGIDLLLKGAMDLLNTPEFSGKIILNLVGKGSLLDSLQKEYVHENIIFHGFVNDEDIRGFYLSNDLFVLPTLFEGMPTVVLEAMSYGLPVILTDVGAASELVDSSNGYLIKRNNLKSLKDSIIDFYNLSPVKKAELSKRSFQKVKDNFSWEIITEKHLDLFKTFKND